MSVFLEKINKVISSSIAAFAIIGSAVVPSVGAETIKPENNLKIQQNQNGDVSPAKISLLSNEKIPGVKIIDITREQYVENFAKNENITYAEADRLVTERTNQNLSMLRATTTAPLAAVNPIWRQAQWIQSYSNTAYKAEMNASFEIYTSGSFRQIQSCTVGSALAAGMYNASWVQSNSWKTTVYPVTTATVGVTGKFYSVVNKADGMSAGISGMSLSSSTSKTDTYASSSMTIQREFSVY